MNTVFEQVPWFQESNRDLSYIVAVSGGADSVALLHVLWQLGFRQLIVCHVNHQLRGSESEQDALFVKELADFFKLPYEGFIVDVRAAMNQDHDSLETAARKLRLKCYGVLVKKHACPRVLLAHHADDQAETIFWNLLRGSYGLQGMKEVNVFEGEIELIRPFLTLRKKQLMDVLTQNHLTWREDSSNQEAIAIRNRLRHEVFPLLNELSKRDVVESIQRAQTAQEQSNSILEWAFEQAHALDPQGRIHVEALLKLPQAVQKLVLSHYLKKQGVAEISQKMLSDAERLLDVTDTHVITLPKGRLLRRREGRIFLSDARPDSLEKGAAQY